MSLHCLSLLRLSLVAKISSPQSSSWCCKNCSPPQVNCHSFSMCTSCTLRGIAGIIDDLFRVSIDRTASNEGMLLVGASMTTSSYTRLTGFDGSSPILCFISCLRRPSSIKSVSLSWLCWPTLITCTSTFPLTALSSNLLDCRGALQVFCQHRQCIVDARSWFFWYL